MRPNICPNMRQHLEDGDVMEAPVEENNLHCSNSDIEEQKQQDNKRGCHQVYFEQKTLLDQLLMFHQFKPEEARIDRETLTMIQEKIEMHSSHQKQSVGLKISGVIGHCVSQECSLEWALARILAILVLQDKAIVYGVLVNMQDSNYSNSLRQAFGPLSSLECALMKFLITQGEENNVLSQFQKILVGRILKIPETPLYKLKLDELQKLLMVPFIKKKYLLSCGFYLVKLANSYDIAHNKNASGEIMSFLVELSTKLA